MVCDPIQFTTCRHFLTFSGCSFPTYHVLSDELIFRNKQPAHSTLRLRFVAFKDWISISTALLPLLFWPLACYLHLIRQRLNIACILYNEPDLLVVFDAHHDRHRTTRAGCFNLKLYLIQQRLASALLSPFLCLTTPYFHESMFVVRVVVVVA
jgi:hypothetical protein